MYQALVKYNIKTTLFIYPESGHGYGLVIDRKETPNLNGRL
jgi:hypothetical protein